MGLPQLLSPVPPMRPLSHSRDCQGIVYIIALILIIQIINNISIDQQARIECFLWAGDCTKRLTCTISFGPHNSPVTEMLLVASFYKGN